MRYIKNTPGCKKKFPENKELNKYIENIKQWYQQYQHQQRDYFENERECFKQKPQKKL